MPKPLPRVVVAQQWRDHYNYGPGKSRIVEVVKLEEKNGVPGAVVQTVQHPNARALGKRSWVRLDRFGKAYTLVKDV